jgi:hypothetical protein
MILIRLWTQYTDYGFKQDLRPQNAPGSNPWAFSSYSRRGKELWQLVKRFAGDASNPQYQRRWQSVYNPDAPKTAAGYISRVETDNEREKNWKDSVFHSSGSMAFYQDVEYLNGNNGADGPDVGVKAADPNCKIIMPGLSFCGNLHWIKHYRATLRKFSAWVNSDGSLKWPFDYFNIHYYPSNGVGQFNGTVGMSPGLSQLPSILSMYQDFIARNMPGMQLLVSEYGWDKNQSSNQRAPAISPYTAEQIRAYWSAQAVFIFAKSGVAHATQYDAFNDGNPGNTTNYQTSGIINSDSVTHVPTTRTPTGDVLTQIGNAFGKFVFDSVLSEGVGLPTVYRFKQKDTPTHKMYVMWNQVNGANISANFILPLSLNTQYRSGSFDESGGKDNMTLFSGTVSSSAGLSISADTKSFFVDVTVIPPINPSGPGRIIKQILSLKHN